MATAQIDIEARFKSNPPRSIIGTRIQADISHPFGKPTPSRGKGSIFDFARNHASDHRFVAAGTELFAEGETSGHLYVVLSGWLFLHRILEDGRRQILDFCLPGAVLGYHAHTETPFPFSAEAITDAEVAVIPLSRVSDLLSRGSSCATLLLDATEQALRGVFDTLTDIGRRTAREAVAHFLLRMDRRIRALTNPNPDGSIPFPLRQEHIGDALGLTSVHVCRTLGKLRNDGLVEIGQGRLHIINADALAADASVYCFDEENMPLAS